MIPGSMGTASYIVEGRGNAFSFCSGSHGAGRVMSRAEALRTISDDDFLSSVEGVFHHHDTRLKDKAPAAYKDIRRVMHARRTSSRSCVNCGRSCQSRVRDARPPNVEQLTPNFEGQRR